MRSQYKPNLQVTRDTNFNPTLGLRIRIQGFFMCGVKDFDLLTLFHEGGKEMYIFNIPPFCRFHLSFCPVKIQVRHVVTALHKKKVLCIFSEVNPSCRASEYHVSFHPHSFSRSTASLLSNTDRIFVCLGQVRHPAQQLQPQEVTRERGVRARTPQRGTTNFFV